MTKKIKIISNPYENMINYYDYNSDLDKWEDIIINNPNSRLRETKSEKSFLPFVAKDIIEIIIDEYYDGKTPIDITFEGNKDEYQELKEVCNDDNIMQKVTLSKDDKTLENARIIISKIKDSFENVELLIKEIINDDKENLKNLNKVSDALKDIIPICVFGNYSSGKSTFINSLIGHEILPSGGDPVTAKIYKITRSKDLDVARIKFKYAECEYELLFEDDNYRVLSGDEEKQLLVEIKNKISIQEEKLSMFELINIVLETINNFERVNKEDNLISSVIEVETPFSKEGIIGQSYFNYVIFDTPGSNSETNTDHKKVLEEALDGFSNGIPVWVSTYETIDSTDNASLCEKINDIKALDKRFTMIVLNKADGSDLSEDDFTDIHIEEILNYNSVERMYASGIYFVSSIMGLGSKNEGKLYDKHYRKVYRSQQEMYDNPNDEDYATLYKYNIMPKQIKNSIIRKTMECSNLIYANSGLYCIELGIETFAHKYSSYNKCQMVYTFLKDIVLETNKKIDKKTANLSSANEARIKELKEEELQLINKIKKKSNELKENYKKSSNIYIKDYLSKNVDYSHSIEQMQQMKNEIDKNFGIENKIEVEKTEYNNAKKEVLNDVDIKSTIKGGLKGIKETISKIQGNIVELKEKKKEVDDKEKEIDSKTADELVRIVNEDYKNNAYEIRNHLIDTIKNKWKEYTKIFKNQLIEIVAGDESISREQKEEISRIIANYNIEEIDEDIDTIFVKSNYLDGIIFGLRIFDSEKISVRKLTSSYNFKIRKFSDDLANEVNSNCKDIFLEWENSLENMILDNLTKLNSSLREKTDMINEDNEKIKQLKESQRRIEKAIEVIEKLMSWKIID